MKNHLTNLRIFSILTILALAPNITLAHDTNDTEWLINRLQIEETQLVQFKELMSLQTAQVEIMSKQRIEIRDLIAEDNIELAADKAAQNARERVYSRASYDERLSAVLTESQLELLKQIRSRKGRHLRSEKH